jgi:Protein of unknown function with HXXEE motif
MKTWFIGLVAFIEAVSVAFFLFLRKQGIAPDKIGLTLVWLLPVTFGLHVCEEFVFPGGFFDWYKTYRPRFAPVVTPSYLFKINAFPGVATVLVALGTLNYMGGYSFGGIRSWLGFVSILAFNGVWHIRGAIQTRRYSPGLVTSIALYIPLAIVSGAIFFRKGVVDTLSAVVCLAVGLAFQPVLDSFKERRIREGELI